MNKNSINKIQYIFLLNFEDSVLYLLPLVSIYIMWNTLALQQKSLYVYIKTYGFASVLAGLKMADIPFLTEFMPLFFCYDMSQIGRPLKGDDSGGRET